MQSYAATRTFKYKATRDVIGLFIAIVELIIGWFILKWGVNQLLKMGNEQLTLKDEVYVWSIWIYFLGFTFMDILPRISRILDQSCSSLEVSSDKVVYTRGWISKSTTTVPANKIRSCSKSAGLLQRLLDTMTITVTTTGDAAEIVFDNIEDGEKAYQLITKVARNN